MSPDLFTAREAAAEVGVSPGTIYSWVSRGYLHSVAKRGRYKLFRLCDVFTAEATRKRKHRRRSTP